MQTEELSSSDRLYNKCAMALSNIILTAAGGNPDGVLDLTYQLLTNQHDGWVGNSGEQIHLVLLEQNKEDLSMWRLRVVASNNPTEKPEVMVRRVFLNSDEVPTTPGMEGDHSNIWLVFPAKPYCGRHQQEGGCPFCDRLFQQGTLFRNDKPPLDPLTMYVLAKPPSSIAC